MKTTMIMLFLALISWGASAQMDHSTMNHSENSNSNMDSKIVAQSNVTTSIKVERSLSTTSIINNYLTLKNALAVDDAKNAAGSGKMLYDAIGKANFPNIPGSKQKDLKDILDDAKENAEHISKSGGDIDHQREHFEILGTDIKDLILIVGADRTLYQIYCPMFNENKGGKWLNETKEVKNPLLGSKMSKCGNVIQEISVK
jgi:hypothetical protein